MLNSTKSMFSRVPRLKAIPGTTLWTGFFVASCLYCFMGWTTCQQNIALSHWSRVTGIYICLFWEGKKISSLQLTHVKECFTCHLHLHLHHHHHQHLGISSWKNSVNRLQDHSTPSPSKLLRQGAWECLDRVRRPNPGFSGYLSFHP